MTPEERWTKIENAIEALIGRQAHHDAQLDKQNAQIEKLIEGQEKQTNAILGLAAVSRTLIEAQQNTNTHLITLAESVGTLTQSVDRMTSKVDQLTDSIDRFLRGLQKPNGREGP